ncbi:MAG: hypothetical protein K1W34_14010 [Lachnospiraceae bacterium]
MRKRIDEANIYVETSLTGPGKRDGWYAAVIRCQTSKGIAEKGFVRMEKETTWYRSVLLAVIGALKMMKPGRVRIYTNCFHVKNIYGRNLMGEWKQNGWKKATGEEIKNKELWQQFFEEIIRMGGTDKIEFRFSKHNDCRDFLLGLIAEKKEEYEKQSRGEGENLDFTK